MNRMLERCAGLDVHKRSVVATARIPDGAGGRQVITHTFGTTTADLLGLRDWLESLAITHVAIAYASHCTSRGRSKRFSVTSRLFDSLTPLAFCGGLGPGSS